MGAGKSASGWVSWRARAGGWAQPPVASPGIPFGLLLLGALLGAGALAAAAGHLAVSAAGGQWPGLSIDGLRCLLIPTRADLGAHVLTYLFGTVLLASVGWTGAALVEQLRGTARLAAAVARGRSDRTPRPLRRAARRLRLLDRVDVVASAEPFAFCYGLLRPRICASTGLASHLRREQVEAVLRHERYHLAQLDPLKLAVGRALAGALFFLPIVADLLRRYELARELAADRSVVAEMSGPEPLAGALYRLVILARAAGPGPRWGTDFASGAPAAPISGVGPWRTRRPFRRHGAPGEAAAGAEWSVLEARIDHLLNAAPPRVPLVSRRAAGLSLAPLLAAAAPIMAPAQSRAAAAVLAEAHLIPGLC